MLIDDGVGADMSPGIASQRGQERFAIECSGHNRRCGDSSGRPWNIAHEGDLAER